MNRTTQRLLGVASAALLGLVLSACAEDDPIEGDVVAKEAISVPVATSAATVQRLTYRMPGAEGGLEDARTVVMIPAGSAPAGGWPVLAWGHGTTGIGDACAPSDTADLSGYAAYLNALLASGYAIVAPDYEGLGVDGIHPYLSLASEGRSLLYAVLAATREFDTLSKRFGLIGHSQGGHAVLGAAEFTSEVPELTLVGTVAIAPASNIRASGNQLQAVITNPALPIADRVAAGVGRVLFSSLILGAIPATEPSFDPAGAFGPDGAFLTQALVTACLSGLSTQITVAVQTAIATNGSVNSLIPSTVEDLPAVAAYLANNEPGSKDLGAPVLLLQGTADTTVFPSATQALNSTLSASGNTVTYTPFTGETHSSIVQASAAAAIAFLSTSFASQ